MLSHISFAVSDLQRSGDFYDAALAALGFRRVYTSDHFIGYGLVDNQDKFALKLQTSGVRDPGPGFHLAFAAPNRAAVDQFYQAAMAHGGIDNGGSGLNPEYGDHYYACFVFDPDGYRVEAVINGQV